MPCREQAKELLNRGWAAGEEPMYSADHALVVCRMHGFSDGLIFLYERMRLFREGLKVAPCHASGQLSTLMGLS